MTPDRDPVPDDEQEVDHALREWGTRARGAAQPALPTLPDRHRLLTPVGRRWAIAATAAAVALAVALPLTLHRPRPAVAAPDGQSTSASSAAVAPPEQVVEAVEEVIRPNYPAGGELAVHYQRMSSSQQSQPNASPGSMSADPHWLASASGHFVAVTAKIPAGAAPPEGSRIFVEVTAAGQVVSWGVGDQGAEVQGGAVVVMRVLPPARSQTVVDPSVSRPPGDQPPAAVLAAVESAIVESDGKGSVWLVRTTLKAATESAIPGKEYVAADGSRRIWLAVQNGDFVIPDHVPGPPGAQSQAKPGHSQWVMMSDDGSVIGMVISPNAAGDLSSLGDVRTITVGQGNTSPSPPINSGAPAPATRPVTYQGVTVDVPADWPVNQVPRCNFGELAAGSVLIPPVAFACVGGAPAQTTTTVSFGWSTRMPDSDPLEPITWTSTGATMIGGLPAVTAVGTRPNKPEEQDRKPGPTLAVRGLYVPDRKTAIVVSTLDPAVAEQILATARITDIDANGCPYRDEDTLALPTKPRSEVTGMDKAILPGTPESISVCKYAEGWLQAGETLDSQERAELQKLLGAAPIGTFRLDTKTYSPDMCRNPKAPIGTVRQLGSGDAEGFVLTATYPDGSRVTALARIAWCGDLGVSNGAHTVQPTIQIATFLTQFAHGGSFSGLLPGSPR